MKKILHLNRGDVLVDDREKNAAVAFAGGLIRFSSEEFPDWKAVVGFLEERS